MVSGLNKNDTVLFLLSGGGSALFEKPKITGEELQDITNQLLACGADIVEINTIRKRLSEVKGGRFAKLCEPAHVLSIVLSDILGDPLDMIASGPACADTTTCEEAWHIVEKYNLNISEDIKKLMDIETPKKLDNVTTFINGSVRELCSAVSRECSKYGYEPVMLTDQLCCQAKEAGSFLASIAKTHCKSGKKLAYIAGGETIVNITGHGKGGRNQEIALSAAEGIKGMSNAAVFSIGSDGTDVQKLAEEDPTFRVHTDPETAQTIISGMGELHLDIIVDRLLREFKVGCTVGNPQVAYRETIRKSVKSEGKFVRQSGGKGQYGHCWLEISPREANRKGAHNRRGL